MSFQRSQIALILWSRATWTAFDKPTGVCFIEIALESQITILFPYTNTIKLHFSQLVRSK